MRSRFVILTPRTHLQRRRSNYPQSILYPNLSALAPMRGLSRHTGFMRVRYRVVPKAPCTLQELRSLFSIILQQAYSVGDAKWYREVETVFILHGFRSRTTHIMRKSQTGYELNSYYNHTTVKLWRSTSHPRRTSYKSQTSPTSRKLWRRSLLSTTIECRIHRPAL